MTKTARAAPGTTWKPTRDECAAIRAAGVRVANGRKQITLEPRLSCSTLRAITPNLNGYLVEPDPDDTDLYDTMPWTRFRAGIPLDAQGRAWVDFYVRPTGRDADDVDGLLGNVTVFYQRGQGIIRWECC